MTWCIVYLASPKEHHIYNDTNQASRLDLLRGSLRIARSKFPFTDILVFHEDYTETEFRKLPQVTTFIRVDFSGREELCNTNLRRPYGYLMMCRFFSGVMQSHPNVRKYTHYMRLDDDSYFMEPSLSETYVTQNLLKYDYVYRSIFHDSKDQQSLFDFTLDFLKANGYGAHIETLKQHLQKNNVTRGDVYTGMAPYNNFHIASQRLWQHPLIEKYIQSIEESNGILNRGWMDANVHAMIIFVLSPFIGMNVHSDTSFGYRHNRHVSPLNSLGIVYIETLPFTAE